MDSELKSYLDEMKADLKAHTDLIGGLRTELKADIDGLRTELKADIADLRAHTDLRIDGLRTELKADIATLRAELKAHTDLRINDLRDELLSHLDRRLDILRTELMAHTEKAETNLLSEFRKWARTSDIRPPNQLHSELHSIDAIAVDERMMALEERVSEIERRRAS